MRRRLKAVGITFFLLLGLAALLLFLPGSSAPYAFLEGKAAYRPPHFVAGSFGGPSRYEWTYVFQEDWGRFVAEVETVLIKEGWTEGFSTTEAVREGSPNAVPIKSIVFQKKDRVLALYKDSSPQMTGAAPDLTLVGTYRPGAIGVCYAVVDYQPPFPEKARKWLLGLFGNKSENE